MKLSEIKNKIEREKEAMEIQSVSMKNVVHRAYDELVKTNPSDVMSFGYDWLDKKLAGIFSGQVILIGGESGAGKSTFAISVINRQTCPTAVFALEERLEDYGKKTMYFEIGKIRKQENKKNYSYVDYITGKLNANQQFHEYFARAYDNLKKEYPLFQEVKKTIVWELIEERIKILARNGIKIVLIDHLHYFDLLAGENGKNDYIEQIMTKMSRLAVETNIAILLIAHYKKLNGNKPTLDSFKDSMAIVQNATTVINLWRNREQGITDADKYKTQIIIPKTRILGGEGTINVNFNPQNGNYEISTESEWQNGTPVRDDNYDLSKLDL